MFMLQDDTKDLWALNNYNNLTLNEGQGHKGQGVKSACIIKLVKISVFYVSISQKLGTCYQGRVWAEDETF